MKDKVVLFQDGYARILINPPVEDLQKLQDANYPFLVNPDLNAVKGISPEFWKLVGINILPMTEEEQLERSRDVGMDEPFQPIIIEREVIKEVRVPVEVEVIKEVIVEKVIHVPVEFIKEVIEEVPVEVIKYITEIKEVEKIVEVPVDINHYIEVPTPYPVEVVKLVEVPVRVEVKQISIVTPQWSYWLIMVVILETCFILLQGALNGH